MRRDDAKVTERRGNDRFERNARHSRDTRITGIRQQMAIDLFHRIARQNQVAEMPAPAVFCRLIDGDAGYGRVPRKKRREQRKLVFARAAAEIGVGKIVGDFLQAQHVKIGDALCFGRDAGGIDSLIDAAAPLHIPGHHVHRIPARMND